MTAGQQFPFSSFLNRHPSHPHTLALTSYHCLRLQASSSQSSRSSGESDDGEDYCYLGRGGQSPTSFSGRVGSEGRGGGSSERGSRGSSSSSGGAGSLYGRTSSSGSYGSLAKQGGPSWSGRGKRAKQELTLEDFEGQDPDTLSPAKQKVRLDLSVTCCAAPRVVPCCAFEWRCWIGLCGCGGAAVLWGELKRCIVQVLLHQLPVSGVVWCVAVTACPVSTQHAAAVFTQHIWAVHTACHSMLLHTGCSANQRKGIFTSASDMWVKGETQDFKAVLPPLSHHTHLLWREQKTGLQGECGSCLTAAGVCLFLVPVQVLAELQEEAEKGERRRLLAKARSEAIPKQPKPNQDPVIFQAITRQWDEKMTREELRGARAAARKVRACVL